MVQLLQHAIPVSRRNMYRIHSTHHPPDSEGVLLPGTPAPAPAPGLAGGPPCSSPTWRPTLSAVDLLSPVGQSRSEKRQNCGTHPVRRGDYGAACIVQ